MTVETSTAERILDVAQDLIQRRGYNSISFNDIAEGVGIKKPSIVHHFPSKSAIGKAVVERYSTYYFEALDAVVSDPKKTSHDVLKVFFSPYLDFGKTNDKICLCGALAGEFMALSEEVQREVTKFFQESVKRLEAVLEKGRENNELVFDENTRILAQFMLDSLQGALIIQRATGQKKHVQTIINTLKSKLYVD